MDAVSSWTSYPKVYALGHPALDGIFSESVVVEEKIDGSHLSFGRFGDQIRIKSKNREFDINAPDNMFAAAAKTVSELAPSLVDGWTYRAEYLQKPHHNALAYDRVPSRNIILFDIASGSERYLTRAELQTAADVLDLECVPMIACGEMDAPGVLSLLDRQSVLGGQRVEGVVVKNHSRFSRDGKPMFGKYVSEAFKEVKDSEWSKANPTQGDVRQQILDRFCSEARWRKAVEHLRDAGRLQRAPQDIGTLMREVQGDVEVECAEEVKEMLWQWVKKDLARAATRGLPEWYKEKLALGEIGDDQ